MTSKTVRDNVETVIHSMAIIIPTHYIGYSNLFPQEQKSLFTIQRLISQTSFIILDKLIPTIADSPFNLPSAVLGSFTTTLLWQETIHTKLPLKETILLGPLVTLSSSLVIEQINYLWDLLSGEDCSETLN